MRLQIPLPYLQRLRRTVLFSPNCANHPFSAVSAQSGSASQVSRLPETSVVDLLSILLFASIAALLIRPIFSRLPWTSLVQDDFFYYLVVAQNVIHGHGSTFNGIVATNGYQPLWFAVILAVNAVTQNPHLIVAFVALSTFLSSLATFFLVKRLISRTGVRPLLVFAFSAMITVMSFVIFCEGMEVTLTVPFLFGLLCMLQEFEWLEASLIHTFYLGLLLAAMVLSRIDTLIIAALLFLGILVSPAHRFLLRWKPALVTFLGFSPVLAYFIFNRLAFGIWLPVSGMAKQLKTNPRPSLLPLHFLLHRPSPALVVVAILGAIALVRAIPEVLPRLSPVQRGTFLAVAVFPFVYYGTLSFISDWRIWPWYWYALRPAVCVLCIFFCLWRPSARLLQTSVASWALVVITFAYLFSSGWPRQQEDIGDAAMHVREFAATHPGIYAMGDRSGQVAYMLPDPMIQLEGLMMDRSYLDYLRKQTPLRSVLAAYHARYYVATEYGLTHCFEAVEPYQAGELSDHLRGEFCDTPVAIFPEGKRQTVIFDLGPQQTSAR